MGFFFQMNTFRNKVTLELAHQSDILYVKERLQSQTRIKYANLNNFCP